MVGPHGRVVRVEKVRGRCSWFFLCGEGCWQLHEIGCCVTTLARCVLQAMLARPRAASVPASKRWLSWQAVTLVMLHLSLEQAWFPGLVFALLSALPSDGALVPFPRCRWCSMATRCLTRCLCATSCCWPAAGPWASLTCGPSSSCAQTDDFQYRISQRAPNVLEALCSIMMTHVQDARGYSPGTHRIPEQVCCLTGIWAIRGLEGKHTHSTIAGGVASLT